MKSLQRTPSVPSPNYRPPYNARRRMQSSRLFFARVHYSQRQNAILTFLWIFSGADENAQKNYILSETTPKLSQRRLLTLLQLMFLLLTLFTRSRLVREDFKFSQSFYLWLFLDNHKLFSLGRKTAACEIEPGFFTSTVSC